MSRPNVAPPAAGKKPKSDHALDVHHRSLRRTEHDDLVRLANKHGLYVPAPAGSAGGDGFYSTRAGQVVDARFSQVPSLGGEMPTRPDRRSA